MLKRKEHFIQMPLCVSNTGLPKFRNVSARSDTLPQTPRQSPSSLFFTVRKRRDAILRAPLQDIHLPICVVHQSPTIAKRPICPKITNSKERRDFLCRHRRPFSALHLYRLGSHQIPKPLMLERRPCDSIRIPIYRY